MAPEYEPMTITIRVRPKDGTTLPRRGSVRYDALRAELWDALDETKVWYNDEGYEIEVTGISPTPQGEEPQRD